MGKHVSAGGAPSNAGPDAQVESEHHDRRRDRDLGARDHGREGPHRNRGTAIGARVPARGLRGDTGGQGRYERRRQRRLSWGAPAAQPASQASVSNMAIVTITAVAMSVI